MTEINELIALLRQKRRKNENEASEENGTIDDGAGEGLVMEKGEGAVMGARDEEEKRVEKNTNGITAKDAVKNESIEWDEQISGESSLGEVIDELEAMISDENVMDELDRESGDMEDESIGSGVNEGSMGAEEGVCDKESEEGSIDTDDLSATELNSKELNQKKEGEEHGEEKRSEGDLGGVIADGGGEDEHVEVYLPVSTRGECAEVDLPVETRASSPSNISSVHSNPNIRTQDDPSIRVNMQRLKDITHESTTTIQKIKESDCYAVHRLAVLVAKIEYFNAEVSNIKFMDDTGTIGAVIENDVLNEMRMCEGDVVVLGDVKVWRIGEVQLNIVETNLVKIEE